MKKKRGRTKKAAEKSDMVGLPLMVKEKLVHYGRNFNEEALHAVDMVCSAAWIDADRNCVISPRPAKDRGAIQFLACANFWRSEPPRNYRFPADEKRRIRDEAWRLIKWYFLDAYDRNDGSFLRDMANVIERLKSPVCPHKMIVANEILTRELFRKPEPTVPDMQAELKKHGLFPDRKTVQAYLEELLGHKPTPAKRGRKPGT